MAPIPKPMTATLLLCLAGSILVTAQTFSPYNPASISGCRTTRTPLPPADAFCNVQGRVNSNGTNPNLTVNPGPLATVDQCADLCKTGVANCEFFSFKPNTTRDPFFPENGLTQGTCRIFKFGPNYFNLQTGPNPADPKTKYFNERCYFTPSSCSFNAHCYVYGRNGALQPCPRSNNFLAADPNGGSPFSPTGFAQNNASTPDKLTRLTNSYGRRLSVIQNNEQLYASVPRSDPQSANSIVSFVPGSALGVTATPLSCQVRLISTESFLDCEPEFFGQLDQVRQSPQLCPRAGGRDRLQYGGSVGDPEGSGLCTGGTAITLRAEAYTAVL